MLRQKSPNSMAASAHGQYGGNQLGQQNRVSRSPGIAGSYISVGGSTATVTTTSITTTTLTSAVTAVPTVDSIKGPIITVQKDSQVFRTPSDINMVTLRSGKQFSPSRSETPKQQRQSTGRKRSQTPDSAERTPQAKRRDIDLESPVGPRGVPTTLFRSQSESDLRSCEPLGTVVQKAVDSSLEKFLKHMESVMDKKLDKCLLEVKSETKKCSEEIEQVKTQVGAIELCAESVKTNLTDFKNETIEKINEINTSMEDIKKSEADMVKRIEELERVAARVISVEPGQSQDKYPLGRTIIMKRVLLEDELQPIDAVKLIVNDALRLPNVRVMSCEIMRTFSNGHNTIKVLLSSSDDLRKVMKTKHMLGRCAMKEIKAVWILQAKSADQRRHEYNNAVLIKQLQLEGKLRQTGSGHLIPVEDDLVNNDTEVDPQTSSQPHAATDGGTGGAVGATGRALSARGSRGLPYSRGLGDRGRGRGRGGIQGRGMGALPDRSAVGSDADDSYTLSEAVVRAFKRRAKRAPNEVAAVNGRNAENMEVNSNNSD